MLTLAEGEPLSERFTLIERLGEGGMGEVWLAEDGVLDDRVAVKILSPALAASTDMVDLLRRECRRTRRLNHPNILRVYDFHNDGQRPHSCFISMELIRGGDLGRFVGGDIRAALPMLVQIAEALRYAHGLGVVHRDLKTSNVLRDDDGAARLTDFGIAATLKGERGDPVIDSGGSVYGMSPQQWLGHRPNPADDIYALGVLIYELVTGQPPFYPDIARDRVIAVPPPLRSPHPIPPRLEGLVMAMLAKDPAARPASMTDIHRQLLALADRDAEGTVTPRPPDSGQVAPGSTSADATLPPNAETVDNPTRRPLTSVPPMSRADGSIPTTHYPPASVHRGVPAWWAGAGLLVLLALAVGVFHYLPGILEPAQSRNVVPSQVEQSPGTSSLTSAEQAELQRLAELERVRQEAEAETRRRAAAAALERERQGAETLRDALREQLKTLEARNVSTWAPEDFDTARVKVAEGDILLDNGDFKAAADAYSAGVDRVKAVTARADAMLDEALARGRKAFEARDAAAAIAAFELATLVTPEDETAQKGVARSRTLDQVIALMDSGNRHEQAGELSSARNDYRKAGELDPDFAEARDAIARVEGRIRETEFKQAMSAGFAALEREDYPAARKAFKRARALKPGSEEARAGLAQAERKIKLAEIARHRRQALALENRERWGAAANHYGAALKLDKSLVFAREGKARSLDRQRIMAGLDRYLRQPAKLSSDKQTLRRALALQREAESVPNPGPQMRLQLGRLAALTRVAGKPVRVRLVSDNQTQVMVYRVGKLGSFSSRDLELSPGTYTAVGYRDGFRDVRTQFSVVAGRTPPPVVVRCEERI